MKESEYSRKIVKMLKEKGAVVNVNTANMFETVGRADIEACYKGKYIALELKTGNYQADPLQLKYLKKVRKAFGIGLLLRDQEGIDTLEDLLYCIDNGILSQYVQPALPEINESIMEVEYD